MNILIVAATTFEIAPLIQYLEEHAERESFFDFKINGHKIYPLVTGVGSLNTAFAVARYKELEKTDVAINAGVAGAYSTDYRLGDVVEVTSDRFADLGVEEADGSFTDVYDLGLVEANNYPFKNGWIQNLKIKFETGLPKVTGLSVNRVHGETSSIARIKSKYHADVESMEGAGFLYACRMADVDCNQIRSISNYVEPRNKDNWAIRKAIDNLNSELIRIVVGLTKS